MRRCGRCGGASPPTETTSAINLRESSYRPSAFRRQPFQAMDVVGLKKRGQGLRSWIRIDASGNYEIIEVDKFTMMLQLDLPAQDLRLLDPLLVNPSTILGREKAIVVSLEQIRCIITADEVLLLNSLDSSVLQYVVELQRRLTTAEAGGVSNSESADLSRRRGSRNFDNIFGNASPHHLPFEFRALELALETACTFFDSQVAELEREVYPLLDELTSKISMLNLERVRRLKGRIVALTRRVQKVTDEIEQLMNDKGKSAQMYLTRKKQNVETFKGDLEQPLNDKGKSAEMYLTRKKQRMESTFYGDHSLLGNRLSISAPVSPVASRPEVWKPEKSFSVAFRPDVGKPEKSFSIAKSQHKGMGSSESATMNIELEMLLEAYFVVIESTLNKFTSLKEYIEDTEQIINMQQDNVRNKLIQFDLLMTTVSFVFTIFGMVAGIFGMNFRIQLYDSAGAFKWVLIITGAIVNNVFLAFCWFFKCKRLL